MNTECIYIIYHISEPHTRCLCVVEHQTISYHHLFIPDSFCIKFFLELLFFFLVLCSKASFAFGNKTYRNIYRDCSCYIVCLWWKSKIGSIVLHLVTFCGTRNVPIKGSEDQRCWKTSVETFWYLVILAFFFSKECLKLNSMFLCEKRE